VTSPVTPSRAPYAYGAEIAELRQTVADLRRRVEALEAARLKRSTKSIAPGALLVAIVDAIGTRAFSSAELLTHARLASPALQQAFSALNIRTARRLGKVLKRLHGHDRAGLRLERVERDKHGVIWAVQVVA
jgi:hypothetical protein